MHGRRRLQFLERRGRSKEIEYVTVLLLVSNRRNPMSKKQKLSSVCKELGQPEEIRYIRDGETVSASEAEGAMDGGNYMVAFEFGKEGKISAVYLDRIDPS